LRRQLEHIDGGFAGINFTADVMDNFNGLTDWQDVDLLPFFFIIAVAI